MKTNILLVDDDPDFVALTQRSLQAKGYDVATATNVRDGLDKAQTLPVDLILLDVMMPGQDGGVLAQVIKADPKLADIPIIFLTALVSAAEAQQRNSRDGKNLYLSKPVNLPELIACMNRQIELRRTRATPQPP